jgi:hypothetical protein
VIPPQAQQALQALQAQRAQCQVQQEQQQAQLQALWLPAVQQALQASGSSSGSRPLRYASQVMCIAGRHLVHCRLILGPSNWKKEGGVQIFQIFQCRRSEHGHGPLGSY